MLYIPHPTMFFFFLALVIIPPQTFEFRKGGGRESFFTIPNPNFEHQKTANDLFA
jgi:hypothetical protein